MIPESMKQIILPNDVWNLAVDIEDNAIYFDSRSDKVISISRLDLLHFALEHKDINNQWWTKLLMAANKKLSFIEYLDKQNPNNHRYFNINWESLEKKPLAKLTPSIESEQIPHIYEHGSDYHKTVAQFLALDLPLSCEYLEWNDKIIISYYLRSNNQFERYLLLIEDGKKKWKLLQDKQMKGFSSGAFFVFNGQLIFIKNRNEVCIYPV